MKNILNTLITQGDLIIAPWVLRKHLFAFGLTKHGAPRGGISVLDKSETEAMLMRELPRYREAVSNGFLLRRVPNLEALFVISNTDRWDDEMRIDFTEQLAHPDARATFAGLLVPPGFSMSEPELGHLIDAPKVRRWLGESGQGEAHGNSWLDTCLARLKRALNGKSLLTWSGEEDEA